ncbi:MAG: hypothetical protein JNJ61_14310, partial [Anaerolineae bacterium]|nr:hypothetical protein [Anaerolineae bacterium]
MSERLSIVLRACAARAVGVNALRRSLPVERILIGNWRLMALLVAVFLALLLPHIDLLAQAAAHARFAVDQTQVLIGEPIDLSLIIEIPEGAVFTLPTFPSQWAAFMVREVGTTTETVNSGVRVIQQRLSVLLWQIGEFQTPETVVGVQLPGEVALLELRVEPVTIMVNSVLQPDDLTLRPFRPPVALPYLPWWMVGLGAVGTGMGVVVGLRYLRRWRGRSVLQIDDSANPVAYAALRQLEVLGAEGVAVTTVYAGAADCIRQYITQRFAIAAMDLTTRELHERMGAVN